MSLPVTAERGARLSVASGSTTLHRATATGQEQVLRFRAPDGRRVLRVTATDAAGNESVAANVSVDVDSTPPAPPKAEVTPAAPGRPDTVLVVRGEPGSTVQVQATGVDGMPVSTPEAGVLDVSGSVDVRLRLANGDYRLALALTDVAGNRSADVAVPARVAIAPPRRPRLSVGSDEGASPVVFVVRGDPHTDATVTVEGHGEPIQRTTALGSDGRGEVKVALGDGAYEAGAVLEDFQGQRSEPIELDEIVVKDTPPKVEFEPIDALVSRGFVAFALRTERGARIDVHGDGDVDEELEATGAIQTVAVRAGAGSHAVTIVVTDRYGNPTTVEHVFAVSEPLGAGGAAFLMGSLGVAGWGGSRLVRRRRAKRPGAAAGEGETHSRTD